VQIKNLTAQLPESSGKIAQNMIETGDGSREQILTTCAGRLTDLSGLNLSTGFQYSLLKYKRLRFQLSSTKLG
jgi:hypothetical protein